MFRSTIEQGEWHGIVSVREVVVVDPSDSIQARRLTGKNMAAHSFGNSAPRENLITAFSLGVMGMPGVAVFKSDISTHHPSRRPE